MVALLWREREREERERERERESKVQDEKARPREQRSEIEAMLLTEGDDPNRRSRIRGELGSGTMRRLFFLAGWVGWGGGDFVPRGRKEL